MASSTTFCSTFADEHDAYMVVSFVNATIVLSIGETMEEVKDTGFLGETRTLSASTIGDDSLLQACNIDLIARLTLYLLSELASMCPGL